MKSSLVETELVVKGILDMITDKITSLFNGTQFRGAISKNLREKYDIELEKSGMKFGMNFMRNDDDIQKMEKYAFHNVETNLDEVAARIKGELQRAALEGGSVTDMKKRMKEVLKDKKIANRLKMVLRTERIRAGNLAQMEGANQSGLTLFKYINWVPGVDDECHDGMQSAKNKYPESKAIPMNQKFTVSYKNKTVTADNPPFHPNCRCVVAFTETRGKR